MENNALKYTSSQPLGLKCETSNSITYPVTYEPYAPAGNNVVRFHLRSQRSFINPKLTYLKFTVKNTNAANTGSLICDGSAHSIIRRLQIFSVKTSEKVEDIDMYGSLVNMLADLSQSPEQRAALNKRVEGYGSVGAMGGALDGSRTVGTTWTVSRLRKILGISAYTSGQQPTNLSVAQYNAANGTNLADEFAINSREIEFQPYGHIVSVGGLRRKFGLTLYVDGGNLQNEARAELHTAYTLFNNAANTDAGINGTYIERLPRYEQMPCETLRRLIGIDAYATTGGGGAVTNTGADVSNLIVQRQFGFTLNPAQLNERFGNLIVFNTKSDWAQNFNPAAFGSGEVSIPADSSMTFTIPLHSSLVGLYNDRYLPLFMLSEGLHLTLEFSDIAFYTDNAAANRNSYSVSNVQLHTQYIDFDDEIKGRVASMPLINLHGQSFKYQNHSYSNNTAAVVSGRSSFIIDHRISSVKALLFSFRINNTPANNSTYRMLGRVCRAISELYCKIGNMTVPNAPIRGRADEFNGEKNNTEFIVELMKVARLVTGSSCMHNMLNPENFTLNNDGRGVTVDGQPASVANSDAITAKSVGRACFGVLLDAFASKSQVVAGVNMNLHNPMEVVFDNFTQQANETTNVDAYLYHDVVYAIKDGAVALIR